MTLLVTFGPLSINNNSFHSIVGGTLIGNVNRIDGLVAAIKSTRDSTMIFYLILTLASQLTSANRANTDRIPNCIFQKQKD